MFTFLRARFVSFRMFKSFFQAFSKSPDIRSSAIKRVVCCGQWNKEKKKTIRDDQKLLKKFFFDF